MTSSWDAKDVEVQDAEGVYQGREWGEVEPLQMIFIEWTPSTFEVTFVQAPMQWFQGLCYDLVLFELLGCYDIESGGQKNESDGTFSIYLSSVDING